MKIKRREFLKTTGLTFSSLMLPQFLGSRIAYGAVDEGDHYFLLLDARFGADVTLGLDPWIMPQGADEQDMFIEYSPDQITQAGKIRLAPAAKSLAPYADRMAIINGILMSDTDNGHDIMQAYIASGDGQGKSPTLSVELAATGVDRPYGVIANAAVSLGQRKVIISSCKVLKKSESSLEFTKILSKSTGSSNSALSAAKASIRDSKSITEDFYRRLNALEKQYPSAPSPTQGGSNLIQAFNESDALVCAAGFLSNASAYGYGRLMPKNGFLDTHNDHVGRHLQYQTDIWEQVSKTVKLFSSLPYKNSGESLLDRTTIMVVSEFSRTPFLNAAKGKDHNPMTNSVLLLGRGVNPGQYGQSQLITRKQAPAGVAIHMARPFDYATGLPAILPQDSDVAPSVGFIHPENVVRTVADLMKADMSQFANVSRAVKPIPGLAKI